MSLLTKEQQETFEIAKDKLSAVLKAGEALNIGAAVEWLSECNALLSIIDDLQARAQTQADIGEKWIEATPEQVKDELQRGFHNGGDWEPDAIIRAHQLIGKQYTEQEIMEMCRIDPSICADGATCDGAIWFACMTGALKAEP